MDFLWVPLVKFIHVLMAAGLLGAVIFVFAHGGRGDFFPSSSTWPTLRKTLILATLMAGATGLLLVIPKHFTFHTPWIQVAIAGVLILITLLVLFFPVSPPVHRRQTRLLCLVMMVLIVIIIHDAVTKNTFFPWLPLS